MKKRIMRILWTSVALAVFMAGCGKEDTGANADEGPEAGEAVIEILPEEQSAQEQTLPQDQPTTQEQTLPQDQPMTQEQTSPQDQSVPGEQASEGVPQSREESVSGRLVVIDAGHQEKGNSEKEPIGPGAAETKAKVAGGTKGCVSGLYEYELTLAVSGKLCEELLSRGYEVMMVRTSHDVNISNAERAQIANDAAADVFIRIHANGSDNSSVSGVETLCQTAENPYNADLYDDSKALSVQVLDGVVNATGAVKRRVVETDTMSGINWCQVPVTIVEMGFMTNETEDALMAAEEYQQKLAAGMADGIDAYFAAKE